MPFLAISIPHVPDLKKGQSYILVTRISKVPRPSLDTMWWNFQCTQTLRKRRCEDRGVWVALQSTTLDLPGLMLSVARWASRSGLVTGLPPGASGSLVVSSKYSNPAHLAPYSCFYCFPFSYQYVCQIRTVKKVQWQWAKTCQSTPTCQMTFTSRTLMILQYLKIRRGLLRSYDA